MWTPEDTHKVTEAIYKNITSNFNNGVRQILTAGKAYHKSLVGMTSSAHSFIEAVGKVGYACQINGQGGTDEIGGAILKLADIQKEMYAKVEECTKALFTEVILPLEHRLENDFKHAYAEHKKYQHGHKGYLSPYIKAQEALKKFRKKSKSRLTFDDSKEIQYVRAVAKFQEKLTDFRTQGLKLALLEERKCYCYLLERLTTFATVQSSYTKKGFEMLASEIPRWKQLCSQPHILPRALDPLLSRRERREQLENSQQNGMVYGDRSNYGSPYHRPVSTEFMRQKSVPSEYAVPAVSMQSKTLPRGSPSVSQNSQTTAQVTAIYAHVGRSDDQLSFNDGDTITLIGEKSDGWQYGFNANTGKYGWFPLSFTDTVNISRAIDHPQLYRAKSIGDLLDSKSQISDMSMSYEMEMPGRSRRPRSLYESSMGKHVNSAPQSTHPSQMSQWSNHLYHTTGGDPSSPPLGSDHSSAQASSGFHTLPRPTPQDLGSQELYCSLPEPYNDPKPPGPPAPAETQALTLPDPPLHVITLPPVPSHPPPSPPCVTPSTPQHEHQPLSRNPSSRSMLSGSQSPSFGNQEPRTPSIREPVPFDNYSITSFRSISSSNLNTDSIQGLTPRSRANTYSNESQPQSYQGIREKIQASFNDRPTMYQTNPRSPIKSMPFPPPPPPPPPPVMMSSSHSLHPDSCLSTHLSQMLGSGEMSAHTLPRHHSSYQQGQHMHHHNQMPPPPQNQMVPPPPQAPPPTQAPMAPPPPPPIASQNQSWGPNSGFPPPPPPTDYHTDEDDQSIRSQMFANVSLRKTQTNDRSAPRLK